MGATTLRLWQSNGGFPPRADEDEFFLSCLSSKNISANMCLIVIMAGEIIRKTIYDY